MMFQVIVNTSTTENTSRKRNGLQESSMIICFAPFLILPLFMNGRLVFAFLGFTIMVSNFVSLVLKEASDVKIIVGVLAGVILTTVSSGTLIVGVLYGCTILYYLFRHSEVSRLMKFISSLCLLPIGIVIFDYSVLMINRNIQYFGGGIEGVVNMLNHGAGRFLYLLDFK